MLFGTYRPYKTKKEIERLELLNMELITENTQLKGNLTKSKSAYSMLKKEEEIRQQQNFSNANHDQELKNS